MKRGTQIVLLLFLLHSLSAVFGVFSDSGMFSSVCMAQKPWAPVDTIQLTSGRKIACVIRTRTSKRVYYYSDSLGTEKSFARRNVHRLIYSDGRAEKLNDLAVRTLASDDYRNVIIVDDKEDVEGLYSYGVVHGESSKSNRSMASAKRSAETRLKKRAVAKGAIFVLVTKRQSTGGYGEVPTYYLEGEAFGVEPPESEEGEGADVDVDDDVSD